MTLEPWAERALAIARLRVDMASEGDIDSAINAAWDAVAEAESPEDAGTLRVYAELLRLIANGEDPVPYLEAKELEMREAEVWAGGELVREAEGFIDGIPPTDEA